MDAYVLVFYSSFWENVVMSQGEERTANQRGRPSIEYPSPLDVVDIGGQEFQVSAIVQTGDPTRDAYIVKNTTTGETRRILGARFRRQTMRDPGVGDVLHRDEGVKVTGFLEGGTPEE